MSRKILFVLSSHGELGETGKPTGYYVPEAAHPWKKLSEAGFETDFVSPLGGAAPAIGANLDDPIQREFVERADVAEAVAHTMRPEDVDPDAYAAIHFVGGHGTMWDFADNERLAAITAAIYEAGGIVAAVCHGPAGLVNVKLSDGSYLIDGRNLTSFTDDEERAVGLTSVVPYLLESRLNERGAKHAKAPNFEPHVVIDDRLVTGQNPKSALPLGEALVGRLRQRATAAAG